MDDYCFTKYKCDVNNIKDKLKKYGVAIVPKVLDKDEIENFKMEFGIILNILHRIMIIQ